MRTIVVGGGGREHALGWKLAQSELVTSVAAIPGNAGWNGLGATIGNVDPGNAGDILRVVRELDAGLVVVGPEAPLVGGVADQLREAGVDVVGPGADGAQLEGSKIYAKQFMERHGIPTADFAVFDQLQPALDHLETQRFPVVIKADGLAAGKGVIIADDRAQAHTALKEMLEGGAFDGAGARVVIEEHIVGEEVSVIALTDGQSLVPLLSSQDHKRAYDHDEGPNTGGMGAYAPTSLMEDSLWTRIRTEVLDRTLNGLQADGIDFRGVLYCGLMIRDGRPYLLEYNVRFGDPECQPLMLLMQSDLFPLLQATAQGNLSNAPMPVWHRGIALCVVMASGGYPGAYEKGVPIEALTPGDHHWGDDAMVFHAGTRAEGGKILTAGGRVLGVTVRASDIRSARSKAYNLVDRLRWPDCHVRSDIGWRELDRLS